MPLVISQRFPLGRFHATRWNQNPFEDPYGEWPPSPWRLLRALAARWFQYSRETGDSDETLRDELLRALASSVPSYRLPELTWRGLELRQYQPTGLEEQYKYKRDPKTKKQVLDYSFKRVGKTLVQDHYRAIPPDEAILWIWNSAYLTEQQAMLLCELLRRILYFGRAESLCHLELLDSLPGDMEPNCHLSANQGTGSPVLVPDPNAKLNVDVLLAATDDERMSRRRIPPGTVWYYARIPPKPVPRVADTPKTFMPSNLTAVQFAIGGRVLPMCERWVKLTERYRGRLLRRRAQQVARDKTATYAHLTPQQRDELSLLAGKNGSGQILKGHQHAYVVIWPDEKGQPARLICFRKSPFTQDELDALLAAAENPFAWEFGSEEWQVRLVPLPFETPLPRELIGPATTWQSVTGFVPPRGRRFVRPGGRTRPGETPSRLLPKLLCKCGFPRPTSVTLVKRPKETEWVYVHATRAERRGPRGERYRPVRLGFYLQMQFPEAIEGPICMGDSSHLGLGLFKAIDG